MDTRINFFKIGIFITGFTFLLVFSILWFGKYGMEQGKYNKYSIYFSESISGLNIGSSIKYIGLEVGKVKDVKINPKNIKEIQVDVLILKNTPIKEDNYAILGNLGVTGLKYIELKGGTNSSKLLSENEDGIKVINSKKSALDSFADSTEDITKEITLLLNQVKKILNDENIENISSILNNSNKSLSNIETFTTHLIDNEKKFDEILNEVLKFSSKSGSSIDSIQKTAESFNALTQQIKTELDKGTFDLKGITQDSFDNFNSVLNSLENSLNQTQDLIKNIDESPSDLLLKQKNIKYGPGEK